VPITVEEKIDSRDVATGDNASAVLRYVIRGTADDGEAKAALANESPAAYDGLVRTGREVSPLFVDVGDPDRSVWEGVARYANERDRPETGQSRFSFDTGGGTQHVTQSIETVGAYGPPGSTPPNYHGAIGVTGQEIKGVDIHVPVYSFTETHYLAGAYVTESYKRTLFDLTGRVNAASFRGLATGEVLFLGASGSARGEEDWEITFRFAASPNRRDITIGSIGPVTKRGWEYMWVSYEDAEDDDTARLVKRPVAVYIERVYEYGDFRRLAIGT
jgi:hypothetical protein